MAKKPKEEPKRPEGRPTKFDPSMCKKAVKLCHLGATDKDLAEFFEVAESTISKWKIEHPEFSESLKSGKMEADAMVANRLFKRAIGYKHKDVDIKMFMGQVITTDIIKYYPPDTTAAIFWLKNRQPKKWRDKQEVMHSMDPETFMIGGKEINF